MPSDDGGLCELQRLRGDEALWTGGGHGLCFPRAAAGRRELCRFPPPHVGGSEEVHVMPVLVVDDDVINLLAVAETLRQDGYEVLTAANGREALEILERQTCRMVLDRKSVV